MICPVLGLTVMRSIGFAQGTGQTFAAPTFTFSGTSRMEGENANPQPFSSGLKEPYARWQFDPSLTIYDIPIGAHVLLTTEQDANRSSMNSAEFVFDTKTFQKMLRDRVMAQAQSTVTDYRAKAVEMQKQLSDPAVMQDLDRYKSLSIQDSLGQLSDSAKQELQDLRTRTADARQMAATATRYASMDSRSPACHSSFQCS